MPRLQQRVDGAWYDLPLGTPGVKGDKGDLGDPGGESYLIVAHIDGVIGPGVGGQHFYNPAGETLLIMAFTVGLTTAPAGTSAIFDANLDGTTIFTNQAHRAIVAAGSFYTRVSTIDVPTWNVGSYLSFDVDQVGSTTPGSIATLTVLAVPAA